MEKPIIQLENVNKEYRFYSSNHQRLRHELFWQNTGKVIQALDDVTFSIYKGEKVALIGNTGAGRSSIMNLVAKITRPNSGKVIVRRKPTLMFDHRLGFDFGLSGRDNYRLRTALLGWPGSQVKKLEDEVIEFAELKEIIDQPVKHYPPGSLNRLGFSIDTAIKPELLLYDELFSLGTDVQIEKCVGRLKELVSDENMTFVMSVGLFSIAKQLCTRAIVIDKAKICFDGPMEEGMKYFRKNCRVDPQAVKEAKERMLSFNNTRDDDSEYSDMG